MNRVRGDGRRSVSDSAPFDPRGVLYLADLPEDDRQPMENVRHLLRAHSSRRKQAHPHSFLSPDGRMAFFNSDESGVLQVYMIRDLFAIG